MAAVLQPGLQLLDLRRVNSADLRTLLQEESDFWRDTLDWDFTRSADLVRRFTEAHALTGAALMDDTAVVGYAYSVLEDHKGIIGDLYIREGYRSAENEYQLISYVLEGLIGTPHVRRVESQLILLGMGSRRLPRPQQLQTYDRNFLEIDLDLLDDLPAAPVSGIIIEPWAQHFQDSAAHLISGAYVSHVDALINDQYRSVAGARRFLYNIVQYPGCGTFVAPASLAAFEKASGWMCGLCLTSEVGHETGHITQVCLARETRGRRLGYEMVRQSLLLLRLHGCKRVSLTVTTSNRKAMDLYARLGFHSLREFQAFVWEGF